MKRIDLVYDVFKKLYKGDGISTIEISIYLGISRANTSTELNNLCKIGLLKKIKQKPVLYFLAEDKSKAKSELDIFLDKNPSLIEPVNQAKAAVLYPPNGMHMILLGETGVGKSMLANIIHEYAVRKKVLSNKSPFIVFNCADYSNNPQLLLGQLFGVKKGSYTGADKDREGLLEQADGGILFLDEIHRLPPVGQEMFFMFLDSGMFRRLGESENIRQAKVLIISATTENIKSHLLMTFKRRIPMTIYIPNLNERTIEERFNLINNFFIEESTRLGKDIKVSFNTIKALLNYNCVGNVGQLKSDIQLTCAKAYLEFISNKRNDIHIFSVELSPHIKEGLYKGVEHRKLWAKMKDINPKYILFNKSVEENIFYNDDSKNKNLYNLVDEKLIQLEKDGMSSNEIKNKIDLDINNFFNKYIYNIPEDSKISNLSTILSADIRRTVDIIISFAQKQLNRKLSNRVCYGLALHIESLVARVRKQEKLINANLNQIRSKYREEFKVALNCLEIIEKEMDVMLPIDEAGFLTIFFLEDRDYTVKLKENVSVIVIAHGESTATSMADTANRLLDLDYAIGINASLDETPEDTFAKVKNIITDKKIKNDILFLIDMGSFANVGKELEEEMGIKTKTIVLVSTLHVMEAIRKAYMGVTLEEIYRSIRNINIHYNEDVIQQYVEDKIIKPKTKNKLAIVSLCTTGEGGAVLMKNILEKSILKKEVDILPMAFESSEIFNLRMMEIKKNYKIVCIISNFKLNCEYKCFNFEEVLEVKYQKEIAELVETQNTYCKLIETLSKQLKHIDPSDAINYIESFNNAVQNKSGVYIGNSILIGITFHIFCMLDRILSGEKLISTIDSKKINENNKMYIIIKKELKALEQKYKIEISNSEIYYLSNYFTQSEI